MKEKMSPPEYTLNPEYWDGHSFEDDCRWIENRSPRLKDKGKAQKFTRETLKDFLSLESKTKIRTLGKGEVFRGNEFPAGTIVRFEREHLRKHAIISTPYINLKHYGVIYPLESKQGEIIPSMVVVNLPLHPAIDPIEWLDFAVRLSIIEPTTIRVGEVDHNRFAHLKKDDWQSLNRVNWLEIWKIGKGIPRQVNQEKTKGSLFGKFLPKPQQA